jgi:hypothetical protein
MTMFGGVVVLTSLGLGAGLTPVHAGARLSAVATETEADFPDTSADLAAAADDLPVWSGFTVNELEGEAKTKILASELTGDSLSTSTLPSSPSASCPTDGDPVEEGDGVGESSDGKSAAAAKCPKDPGFTVTPLLRPRVQSKSNWCGPAVMETVLGNWMLKTRVPTQAKIADKVGTDRLGFTSPLRMARGLSEYLSKEYGWKKDVFGLSKTITNAALEKRVKAMVGKKKNQLEVFIVVVQSRKIWYPKAGKGVAHYLIIYGYNPKSRSHGFRPAYLVYDPIAKKDGGGVHSIAASDWEKIAFPGRFVIAERYVT